MLLFVPEANFKFSTLEKEIGPLCAGGCEKMLCMAEIQVTSDALRWPARIFGDKMCSFDVTGSEKTLLVTLYNKYMEHSPFQCLLLMLSSFLSFLFCFKSTPPDFFLLLYVRHENKTVLAFPDFYIQFIPESEGWISY